MFNFYFFFRISSLILFYVVCLVIIDNLFYDFNKIIIDNYLFYIDG